MPLGPAYIVDPALGCWLWQGYIRPDGRANLWADGRQALAYRWYYEQYVGEIPPERHLHHTCEVARCVNPGHMRIVTAAEHARLHPRRVTPRTATCA